VMVIVAGLLVWAHSVPGYSGFFGDDFKVRGWPIDWFNVTIGLPTKWQISVGGLMISGAVSLALIIGSGFAATYIQNSQKLSQFRLGALIKLVVVVHLIAAMVWGNLAGRLVDPKQVWGEQGWPPPYPRVANDYFSESEIRIVNFICSVGPDKKFRVRGWPYIRQVEIERGGWEHNDTRASLYDNVICITILLGVLLALRFISRPGRSPPDEKSEPNGQNAPQVVTL
jgi:hypothetical protein